MVPMNSPPVRVCCMQAHHGPVCPDGKVMCCLCFERFEVADLNEIDGKPEDVCQRCAEAEGACADDRLRQECHNDPGGTAAAPNQQPSGTKGTTQHATNP